MNVKHFRWLFLPIVALPIFLDDSKPIVIGASQSWSNGQYRFGGGTDPKAIAYSLGIIFVYVLFLSVTSSDLGNPMPGLIRRFVAFWLDFVLYMMAIAPLMGVVPTLVEWRRTGVFAWNFEREGPAPSDGWITGILLVLGFACMILYFALPLVLRKPSPGACIMGYQIVSDDGEPFSVRNAVVRTLFGFRAVSPSYSLLFRPHPNENGKFWLDEKFGTHAANLE